MYQVSLRVTCWHSAQDPHTCYSPDDIVSYDKIV